VASLLPIVESQECRSSLCVGGYLVGSLLGGSGGSLLVWVYDQVG